MNDWNSGGIRERAAQRLRCFGEGNDEVSFGQVNVKCWQDTHAVWSDRQMDQQDNLRRELRAGKSDL